MRERIVLFIIQALEGRAKVGKGGAVTIEAEVEEDGVKVKKQLPPKEAIALLEQDPEFWPLFKSRAGSGTGEPSGGTLKRTTSGVPDVSNMSMDDYAAMRAKNPQLFGLE